jgi:hypothetical protein
MGRPGAVRQLTARNIFRISSRPGFQAGFFFNNRRGAGHLNTFLTPPRRLLTIRSRCPWQHCGMNDIIFITVMIAVFLVAQLYAHWCGKL